MAITTRRLFYVICIVTFSVTTLEAISNRSRRNEKKYDENALQARDILAFFGAHRLNEQFEVERLALEPEKVIIHEDWNPADLRYDADISLLKFEEGKIQSNNVYIVPICIWDSNEDLLASDGVIIGWGERQSSKQHEDVPRLTKVTVRYNEECLVEFPLLAKLASSRTFCAGNKKRGGACSGDSGGGLVVKIEGIYYLKGITSAGKFLPEGGCDISQQIYTNVHKFTDWIKNQTRLTFKTSVKGDL